MDGICSRYEKADKMTYPRLGAMCETVWRGENSYEQFHNKLDYYYSYLDKNRIGYSKLYFANPNRALGFLQRIWFEKRQLTWEGLSNIFDDLKVKYIAKRTVIYNFMRIQTSVMLIKKLFAFSLMYEDRYIY